MNLLLFDYNKAFLQVYDTFEDILKTHIITDNVRLIDQTNLIGHLNESFREFYLQNVYSNYTEFLIAYLAMIRSRPSKQILIKVCSDFILNWQKQIKKCCDLQIFLYIIHNSKESKKLFEIYYYIRKTLFSYQTQLYRNNALDMLQYDFEEANRLFKSLFSTDLCKSVCQRFVMLIQKHQKTVYKGNVMKGNFIAEFVLHEYLELKEKQPELLKEVIIHNRMLVKEQNKYEFRKRFKINDSIIDYSPQQTGKNQGNKKFVLDLSILNQQKLGLENQIQSQNQFNHNSTCNGQDCEHYKQIEVLQQRESQLVSQNVELKQSNQKIQKQLMESLVEVESMKQKFEQMKNLTETLIQKQQLSTDSNSEQELLIIQQQVNHISKEFDEIQVSVRKKISDQVGAKVSQKQQYKKLKLSNPDLDQNSDSEASAAEKTKRDSLNQDTQQNNGEERDKRIKNDEKVNQISLFDQRNKTEGNKDAKPIQLFKNNKNQQILEQEKDQIKKNEKQTFQPTPQNIKQNQNSFLKLSQVGSEESFIKIRQTESTLTYNNIPKNKTEENQEPNQNENYVQESIVQRKGENVFKNNLQNLANKKSNEDQNKNPTQISNYQIQINGQATKIIELPIDINESPCFRQDTHIRDLQKSDQFNQNEVQKQVKTLADSSSVSSSIEDIYINSVGHSVVNENKIKEFQQNNAQVQQLNLFSRGNDRQNSFQSQQQSQQNEKSQTTENKQIDSDSVNKKENDAQNRKLDSINSNRNNQQNQTQLSQNQNFKNQQASQRKSLQENQEQNIKINQFESQSKNDQYISKNSQDSNKQDQSPRGASKNSQYIAKYNKDNNQQDQSPRPASKNSQFIQLNKVQQDDSQFSQIQKQVQQIIFDNNKKTIELNSDFQSIESTGLPSNIFKNQDQQIQNQKNQEEENQNIPCQEDDQKCQFQANKNIQISNRNYSPSFNSDHFHVQSVGNSSDQNQQPKTQQNDYSSIKQQHIFDIQQHVRSNSSNDSQNHQSVKSSSFNEEIAVRGNPNNNSKYSDNSIIQEYTINDSQQTKSRGSIQTEKRAIQKNEIQYNQSNSNSLSQISYAKSKESLQGNIIDSINFSQNQQKPSQFSSKDQKQMQQQKFQSIQTQILQKKQQQKQQQYEQQQQVDEQLSENKKISNQVIQKNQTQIQNQQQNHNDSEIQNYQQPFQAQLKQNIYQDSQSRQAKESFKLENVNQQFTFDIPEEEDIADENSETSAYQSKEKQENSSKYSKNRPAQIKQSVKNQTSNIQNQSPQKQFISPEKQYQQSAQKNPMMGYQQNQNGLNNSNYEQKEQFNLVKSSYIERTPDNQNKMREIQSSGQKSDINSSHSPYRKSMYVNYPSNQLSSGFKSGINNVNSNQLLQYSATSNHSNNKYSVSKFEYTDEINPNEENQNNVSSYNPFNNNQQVNYQQKTPIRNSQQIQNQNNQNGQRNSMLGSQNSNNRSVLAQKNERNSILDTSQLSDNKSKQSYIITVQDSINEINNSNHTIKGNNPIQKLTNILQDIDSPMVNQNNHNIQNGSYQSNDQPTFEGAMSKYSLLKQNKQYQQKQLNNNQNKSFDQQSEQDDVERQSDIWLRDSVIQNEEEQNQFNKQDRQSYGPFKMSISSEQIQDLRQSIPKPIFYGVPIQFSQNELLRKN